MLSLVAEVPTVFDILICQERFKHDLRDNIGIANVIADVVCSDEKIEKIISVEAFRKPLMFSTCLLKHVACCSQFKKIFHSPRLTN